MTETSPSGEEMLARLSSKVLEEKMALLSPNFASEMGKLAMENVFNSLWARPGLDPRSRSLVTLGILIAQGASYDLKMHVVAAIRNGLTIPEIEEVIYHATGYAGFPAATAAQADATDALRKEGLIA